jgi:hypothetical protein
MKYSKKGGKWTYHARLEITNIFKPATFWFEKIDSKTDAYGNVYYRIHIYEAGKTTWNYFKKFQKWILCHYNKPEIEISLPRECHASHSFTLIKAPTITK